jgi:hypothetical protein
VAAPIPPAGASPTAVGVISSSARAGATSQIAARGVLGPSSDFDAVRFVRANLSTLAPEAQLRIRRIEMSSPGVVSLEGSGEPIEQTGKLIERLTLLNQKRKAARLANESLRLDLARKQREEARDEKLDEIAIARERIHLVEELFRLRFGDDFRDVPGIGELMFDVLSGAKDVGALMGSVRPELPPPAEAA